MCVLLVYLYIIVKTKKNIFNMFMARLGYGIAVCIFMTRLGHVGSLKFKYNQTETTQKLIKIWFENINQINHLFNFKNIY